MHETCPISFLSIHRGPASKSGSPSTNVLASINVMRDFVARGIEGTKRPRVENETMSFFPVLAWRMCLFFSAVILALQVKDGIKLH